MAAAGAIAEHPERIRRIFVNQDFTNSGIFQLKFFFKGQKTIVNIDDKLAVNAHNKPMFAQNRGSFWMPLVEKAFAKMNVHYLRLHGGASFFALRQLTGMPAVRFYTNEKGQTDDKVWAQINEWDKKKYIMVAATTGHKNYGGLVRAHGYSLLSPHVVNGVKMVKMRNPWAGEAYKGQYSDKDPFWNSVTDEVKKKIGYTNANDGVFFFPFDKFRTFWANYEVAYYNENYKVVSYKNTGPNPTTSKPVVLYIDNPINQEVFVQMDTLSHSDRPINCSKGVTYNYWMGLYGGYSGKVDYWASEYKFKHRGLLANKLNLKKGQYRLVVLDWNNKPESPADFIVNTYADK
jgi:hypothetical protein